MINMLRETKLRIQSWKCLILISLAFLSFPNFSYAKNYLTVVYSAKSGDSLKKIVLQFLKEGTPPENANQTLILTMKKNPSIKSWNPIKSNVIFKLFLDPAIVDLKKYNYYYAEHKKNDAHHLSVSVMPYIGFFSQSNKSGYNLKYNQISLTSLEMKYIYAPYKKSLGISANFYYSMISSTSNQISDNQSSSVDIPAEYGGNLYGFYKPELRQFSFFAGLDFENFSSFNIENILNSDSIAIDSNNVNYITLGTNFAPTTLENFVFKLAVSKSLTTKTTNAVSTTQQIKLSGIKVLFLINYQLNEKWTLDMSVKNHNFSGDNELSIRRFGLGINYSFF